MRAIGVTVWSMYDYEADDGLATGARRWVDDVEQVVVISPDKDMSQLYGDPRIVGYDRRKGAFIARDAVVEKFGVEPESIPDWLAMADVGLLCLHPDPRYLTSFPVKLFEYMACGLPVIVRVVWKLG